MKRSDFEIEICAGNIQSVIEADKAGADRVELCENLLEGGTTPSIGSLVVAKENTNLDVFALIRPRGGDFLYNKYEFEVMLKDIELLKQAGADGIVIGCLNPDFTVDYEMCSRLIEAANGLSVTFHRAFDIVPDPFQALQTIKSLGVQRILTSGQMNTAIEGKELLKDLVEAAGKELKIMPGGGINENNIVELAKKTGAKCFHGSLRVSKISVRPKTEVRFMGLENIAEDEIKVSDAERIKNMINQLMKL